MLLFFVWCLLGGFLGKYVSGSVHSSWFRLVIMLGPLIPQKRWLGVVNSKGGRAPWGSILPAWAGCPVSRWCLGGVSVVSRWCRLSLGGFLVVSRLCLAGVMLTSCWRHAFVLNWYIKRKVKPCYYAGLIFFGIILPTSIPRARQQVTPSSWIRRL